MNMMTGALTGKTGYTSKAGYCYVGALRQDDKTFVVALLACGWPNHKTYKWSDTRVLMEYGLGNYQYRGFKEVPIPEQTLENIAVSNAQNAGIGEKIDLEVEAAGSFDEGGLLMREDEKVTVVLHKVKTLTAPVEKGKEIGHISYMVGNREWKRINLITAEEIEAIDFEWCIRQVFHKWTINDENSLDFCV